MTPPDILTRLRAETAAAHQRLDGSLGLTDPALTRAAYSAILARLHGFWRGWQPQAAARLADPAFSAPRQRLHLLAADLAALGFAPAEIDNLPVCPPPPLASAAAALGSLYVMEGSTLGGRVILKNVTRLGLTETAGASYFAGYGAQTGAMWKSFLQRLSAAPEADAPAIITGANATFTTLANWLTPAAAHTAPQTHTGANA